MGKPTPSFPNAIADDEQLAIAVNRFTTTLALQMGASDTQMVLSNPGKIVPDMLLSVDTDGEIVQVSGTPSGNTVPIRRGFDGTTPVVHLAGATVAGLVDAYHHNALVAEVQAIEATLGTNLSRVPTTAFTISSEYQFTPQTGQVNLTPGMNVVALSPVPQGLNGTDQSHWLWISGGTGAPEAVLIAGGTAVSGAESGTLFFSCANSHSGNWTISSATAGIQEAIQSLDTAGTGGTIIIPPGNWPTHAPITIDIPAITLQGSGRGATTLMADLTVCPVIQIGTGNRSPVPDYDGITSMTITRAPGAIPLNCIGVLWFYFNMGSTNDVEYSRHFIGEKTTHPGGSICIGLYSNCCLMWGCTYAYVHCEHVAGVKYSKLYMGASMEAVAGQTAPTNAVVISADANGIQFIDCDTLAPIPWTQPTAIQWGVLFTAMPSGTGYFVWNNCNWENLGKGVFTSDATCTGISWLELNVGRDGTDGSCAFTQFNAATAVQQFNLRGVTLASQVQLTNPKWSTITNCFIGGRMRIAGGDILISNNVFVASPAFSGNFRCLNLAGNSFVFNGSAQVSPDLSQASGLIYIETAHDQPGFRLPSSRPEGDIPLLSGGTLTFSDTFCTIPLPSATVSTIALPYPDFSGVIYIACPGVVTFTTGGNIAGAVTTTAGQLVTAVYSSSQAKWFLK